MSLGAIAAGNTETLIAAEEMLRAGGNAFDAAIAASFAMFASEPCMSSAGAGGFAMCHSVDHGTRLLDFFTQTPNSKNLRRELDFNPIVVDFGNETETFHVGKASIATPGVIAGLFEMHSKLGTMPIKELIQQAKTIAKRGVQVDEFEEIDLNLLKDILIIDPVGRGLFFKDGSIKKLNDTLIYPQLPNFLDFLANEGKRGFYEGEIASKVSKEIYEGGGFLSKSDFENYEAKWSEPMKVDFYNHVLCMPNGPSLGGAIMSLLNHHDSVDHLPLTSRLLQVKEEIHEKGGIKKSMDLLCPEMGYAYQGNQSSTKGTSHLSVVDKKGNSVALTVSIGEGSGYWIPGTDMQMNNMLGESFLIPDGYHSWSPDRRMNSMMTPITVLNKEGKIAYAGGSGGAGRIPYVIYQVLGAIYAKGLDLEAATMAPRQHWHEGELHYENGAQLTDIPESKTQRCWDQHSLFFGGVHSIMRDSNGKYSACGDPRRYGVGKVIE